MNSAQVALNVMAFVVSGAAILAWLYMGYRLMCVIFGTAKHEHE